jgi:hypothetical protein
MCCKNFWKRIVPFTLAVWLGLSIANIFSIKNIAENNAEKTFDKVAYSKQGIGLGGMRDNSEGLPLFYIQNPPKEFDSRKKTFQIFIKPRPNYTDAARQNQVEGKVRLRVNFLATGKIGSVSPIISLPDGLTEQAMAAAR